MHIWCDMEKNLTILSVGICQNIPLVSNWVIRSFRLSFEALATLQMS